MVFSWERISTPFALWHQLPHCSRSFFRYCVSSSLHQSPIRIKVFSGLGSLWHRAEPESLTQRGNRLEGGVNTATSRDLRKRQSPKSVPHRSRLRLPVETPSESEAPRESKRFGSVDILIATAQTPVLQITAPKRTPSVFQRTRKSSVPYHVQVFQIS